MIKMTLAEVTTLLNLPAIAPATEFQGMSIDTRTLQPGNLFVAIAGERLDGHDYVLEAQQKGATAIIVSHPVNCDIPQIVVPDTTLALGKIASAWRDKFDIPVIAVTGSNGKTTLKNMLAAIMTAACQNQANQVIATQGNLNNYWGLPITLSRLGPEHRYAAIEMGMNHFGEIEYLTKLTRPDVAIITNAGAAHLEGVGGSIEGVARAKAEIFLGLPEDGIAILNRDDAFYSFWREQIGKQHYLTFGLHPDADVHATVQEEAQQQKMTVSTPDHTIEINLPLLGQHNARNALAAIAATLAVGIDIAAVKAGLEHMQPAPGRLQLHTLANGVKIIDDTYNANPYSLQAAVETLATFAGKKILVLGDMKELGESAKTLHLNAGEKIRQAGIDYLFTFGELSAQAALGFGEGAYHFNEQEKLVNALKPFLYNQTTILVKGSRSMRMEKVIAGLVQ